MARGSRQLRIEDRLTTGLPSVASAWTDEEHWTDDYVCEPFGLLAAPRLDIYR